MSFARYRRLFRELQVAFGDDGGSYRIVRVVVQNRDDVLAFEQLGRDRGAADGECLKLPLSTYPPGTKSIEFKKLAELLGQSIPELVERAKRFRAEQQQTDEEI